MDFLGREIIQDSILLPPSEPRPVSPMRGLSWLKEGFQLFAAQPGRWVLVLGLWLILSLVMPTLITVALEDLRRAVMIAVTPLGLQDILGGLLELFVLLAPLSTVLLFPVVFAGLMVGCGEVAYGRRLSTRHLFAAFFREPSRFITVGGINAVGQILMSQAITWFIHDKVGELDLSLSGGLSAAQNLSSLMEKLSQFTPLVLPVLILQMLLMAALWFTPPLLVFHQMTPMTAVRASLLACAQNIGALLVYSLAVILMLSFVGAVSMSAGAGILFAVLALGVLVAAMTTVIASLFVSYRDIFSPHA
jgi:hypothetical protein